MDSAEDHVCEGTDGEWVVCIEGTIYGPCGWENCGGVCMPFYSCECVCHQEKP